MAKTVLFPGQFLLDRRDQVRIVGFHGGGKGRLQTAVAADQIFMEIPARGLQRAFLCRPFVERMGVRALDRDLFGEREGDMVVALGGLLVVYRVRECGSAARCYVFFPDLRADGQRSSARAFVRAGRLESCADLSRLWPRGCHRLWLD